MAQWEKFTMQETQESMSLILGQDDPLRRNDKPTPVSSFLEIPWTEESGELVQRVARVGRDLAIQTLTQVKLNEIYHVINS